MIGLDAGGLVLLVVAALLLMRVPRARQLTRDIVAMRPLRWLPGIGSAAVIGGLVWLAVRPYLQTVRGVLGPGAAGYVATLQRIAGLRVDPTRLYSEDTLYWVIWYAGIATVLLGGFGAAILLRRCLRDLLNWRNATGTSLNWALPMAIVLAGCGAILWQPFTVPDQPWASRRLVPVVIPGLILLAIWAAAWLTKRARERGAGVATAAVVGAFSVGAMLLPSVSTSFGFGLTHAGTRGGLQPTAGGLAQHSVGAHEADAVRSLCSSIGQSSVDRDRGPAGRGGLHPGDQGHVRRAGGVGGAAGAGVDNAGRAGGHRAVRAPSRSAWIESAAGRSVRRDSDADHEPGHDAVPARADAAAGSSVARAVHDLDGLAWRAQRRRVSRLARPADLPAVTLLVK